MTKTVPLSHANHAGDGALVLGTEDVDTADPLLLEHLHGVSPTVDIDWPDDAEPDDISYDNPGE